MKKYEKSEEKENKFLFIPNCILIKNNRIRSDTSSHISLILNKETFSLY